MNPVFISQSILLSKIDFSDFSYSITPERKISVDEGLEESIARHGILHPPIVREMASGLFCIIAGRKRLLAARSLAPDSACTCLVISRQVPEIDIFHVLLEEALLTRQLTAVEKGIFLQKISAILEDKQIAREFLPRLGLAPDPFAIKQMLMLLDLEDPILYGIHLGHVNEAVARDFIPLAADERMALFKIIVSLRLSFSNQKKLLTMCRELASRGNTGISAILDNDEVHAILQHPNANPPQKAKNLMTWLAGRHMPRSTQAEEEFRCFINSMQLPQHVSIEHAAFFENDSMTLCIIFTNRKSLQDAWGKIRHAIFDNDN